MSVGIQRGESVWGLQSLSLPKKTYSFPFSRLFQVWNIPQSRRDFRFSWMMTTPALLKKKSGPIQREKKEWILSFFFSRGSLFSENRLAWLVSNLWLLQKKWRNLFPLLLLGTWDLILCVCSKKNFPAMILTWLTLQKQMDSIFYCHCHKTEILLRKNEIGPIVIFFIGSGQNRRHSFLKEKQMGIKWHSKNFDSSGSKKRGNFFQNENPSLNVQMKKSDATRKKNVWTFFTQSNQKSSVHK